MNKKKHSWDKVIVTFGGEVIGELNYPFKKKVKLPYPLIQYKVITSDKGKINSIE
jgi:hypothetical protein